MSFLLYFCEWLITQSWQHLPYIECILLYLCHCWLFSDLPFFFFFWDNKIVHFIHFRVWVQYRVHKNFLSVFRGIRDKGLILPMKYQFLFIFCFPSLFFKLPPPPTTNKADSLFPCHCQRKSDGEVISRDIGICSSCWHVNLIFSCQARSQSVQMFYITQILIFLHYPNSYFIDQCQFLWLCSVA